MLGFIVGLSEAVIPGPLLAFVIFDAARKHRGTGHFVIVGHALWEALIICLILFGLGCLITQFRAIIYMAGGAMLILMGLLMVRGMRLKLKAQRLTRLCFEAYSTRRLTGPTSMVGLSRPSITTLGIRGSWKLRNSHRNNWTLASRPNILHNDIIRYLQIRQAPNTMTKANIIKP